MNELRQENVELALLSEAALAEDWLRPEEDEAWAHLQRDAWIPVRGEPNPPTPFPGKEGGAGRKRD